MGTCVAYNCTNRTSKKIPGITFHRFPKDAAKRAAWILAVRRKNWRPAPMSTICSVHFPEHMIDRTSLSCVRLREGAVPSIFDFSPSLKKKKGLIAVIRIIDAHNHSLNTVEALKFLPASYCKGKFLEYFKDGMNVAKACRYHEGVLQLEGKFTKDDMMNPQINPPYRSVQYWYDTRRLQNIGPRTGLLSAESTGTTSKDEDKKMDHIPLEPAIEIKEEPVDYEPAPSTSTEAANEEFILPHEESTWTPAVQPPPNPAVEPQLTLSVAGLASHNNLETSTSTSNSEQVGKKRKIKSSTFVPSTNGSEARPVSPVYNFGESSNPGSLKEPRKDQFDVFGEYIAAKLRSLDKKSRAYAQKAIGDIIFEAEMGKYLNEDSETKVLNTSGS